jgi:hypothetical protein
MAKLVCSEKRRVMVLPSTKVIHRSDGSPCVHQMLFEGRKVSIMTHPDKPGEFLLGVGERA